MSRIATLTTIVAVAVAPAAIARPADYRSADPHAADRIATGKHVRYQRPPDCCPNPSLLDAPTPAAKPSRSDSGNDADWAILAVAVAALTAATSLAVKTSRRARPRRAAH
jgi:hypothetical protein